MEAHFQRWRSLVDLKRLYIYETTMVVLRWTQKALFWSPDFLNALYAFKDVKHAVGNVNLNVWWAFGLQKYVYKPTAYRWAFKPWTWIRAYGRESKNRRGSGGKSWCHLSFRCWEDEKELPKETMGEKYTELNCKLIGKTVSRRKKLSARSKSLRWSVKWE